MASRRSCGSIQLAMSAWRPCPSRPPRRASPHRPTRERISERDGRMAQKRENGKGVNVNNPNPTPTNPNLQHYTHANRTRYTSSSSTKKTTRIRPPAPSPPPAGDTHSLQDIPGLVRFRFRSRPTPKQTSTPHRPQPPKACSQGWMFLAAHGSLVQQFSQGVVAAHLGPFARIAPSAIARAWVGTAIQEALRN